MALDRPTLPALIARVLDDLDSALPGKGVKILRTRLNAIGRTLAGVVHGFYGFVETALREALPDKANAAGLARWGALKGVTRDPATPATGQVDIIVTTPQTLAAEVDLVSSTGAIYKTTDSTALSAGTITIDVQARVAGAAGNLPAGAELQFVTPISGIATIATVTVDELAGGFDEEDVESWRGDILLAFSSPASGGTIADIQRWALDVTGVWMAWAKLSTTLGTVNCWIVQEGSDVDPNDIGAPAPLVTAVQDYIDPADTDEGVAPVTMTVDVAAATVVAQNFTIEITPNTSELQDEYEAVLQSYLLANLTALGTTVTISRLERLASSAIDEIAITSPGADIVVPVGSVLVLGTITWV